MAEDRGLVAITGTNGTIGYACTLQAAQAGYRVRCIVRRDAAIEYIQRGPTLQQFVDRVDFAVVPDNTAPGAYDEALQGAKYVIHVAGVWPKPNYHPDNEVYYPFVKSMENVISAAKNSGTVRRVVFTQAGAALVNPDDGDTLGTRMEKVLNETVDVDANSASLRPPLASAHHAYCAAKAHCMKHLEAIKSKLPFDIVQIIPGTVIGGSELHSSASEAYAQMDRMSRAILFDDVRPRYAFGFVDVNDCAAVHVGSLDEKALPTEEIPRWLIAAATTEKGKTINEVWREVGEAVERHFPKEVEQGVFRLGKHNIPINMPYRVDSGWTQSRLLERRRFKSFEDCVLHVAKCYLDLRARDEEKS
ncbi:NAD(P)-binding protein [Westerdykella ornata]|uniref:NAD(P)-binding protein n=1 Tax=Westerdykella ornata TaxID=318751 RepID=A0A6A6JMX7_WESOR|nr:NAD(P)-binding protein [Westerdykella ornata]KAF2277951.1 NAD(P)-binding protein [Westerdykella ornata]